MRPKPVTKPSPAGVSVRYTTVGRFMEDDFILGNAGLGVPPGAGPLLHNSFASTEIDR